MLARYLAGAVAARTGNEMSGPALLVLALAVTRSPVVASSLLAGLTVSAAVGGPLLGVLLDRAGRPGRMLGLTMAGYAAGLVLIVLGIPYLPHALLIGIAVVTGLLGPAMAGGWTAQLPLVATGDRLARANALDAMTYNVGGLAGPAAVGVIATTAGPQPAALAAVALIVAAVAGAWSLPRRADAATAGNTAGDTAADTARDTAGDAARDPAKARGVRAELAAGFSAIARPGPLRRATATSVVSIAGEAMFVVCAPLLGARLLGEPGYGAMLLTVMAVAGLAANAVLARVRHDPDVLLVATTLVLGLALALAALATSFALAVVAAALAGLAEGPQLTALFAVRHRESPPRLRSQIFTTGASLKITSFALGSAAAGPLATVSPGLALLVGAGIQVLAALTFAALSRRP
ncbi:MFS transporter [Thermoactinospora rubra]|uniref:MFS transporter n=1 Tax=Thermoactinospora rubra TaxID=1088767 RepID=UPI001F0A519E|nr:MFS transporter [Thermoactinospora rubra]